MDPVPASERALAILRSPDRRTSWAVAMVAQLTDVVPRLDEAMAALHEAAPIVGARLRRETWHPGPAPTIVRSDAIDASPFDLAEEPPLRVSASGDRVVVVGHHAAFDGRGLLEVMRALLAGGVEASTLGAVSRGRPPSRERARAHPGGAMTRSALARVAHPSDVVAPTRDQEVFVARQVGLSGRGFTGRLADAAVGAVAEHNARLGRPWVNVGITLGIGGDAEIGNTATYRRCAIRMGGDVRDAVERALASGSEPVELTRAPRLAMRAAALVAGRLSDSLLVSSLGRVEMPRCRRIEFYPVARGRSAVALGAAAVVGGEPVVTLRSMHLAPEDAERLLERIVDLLA